MEFISKCYLVLVQVIYNYCIGVSFKVVGHKKSDLYQAASLLDFSLKVEILKLEKSKKIKKIVQNKYLKGFRSLYFRDFDVLSYLLSFWIYEFNSSKSSLSTFSFDP